MILSFGKPTEKQLQEIPQFIAKLNQSKENYIGFCGDDANEIAHAIQGNFTDVVPQEAFVVATRRGELVGVLGFDMDLRKGRAELWGPFVNYYDWDRIANRLWSEALQILPEQITLLTLFFGSENKNCLDFVRRFGFSESEKQLILAFHQESLQNLRPVEIIELTPQYLEEMITLHDTLFPDTYLSGHEIIDHQNTSRKVLIAVEDMQLQGYVYVEAEPEFAEGHIHFLGVNEEHRNKGVGENLLIAALRWLFSFDPIKEISLVVNIKEKQAVHIYNKIGFHELRRCFVYQLKIDRT